MDLFTLNRQFIRQEPIEKFKSAIWTERYYGDGDIELIVPATIDQIQRLGVGTFIGLLGSGEVMMLEDMDIEKGDLKVTGKSLLPFLNNRFIRDTAAHENRYWYLSGGPAGWALWAIIYWMCISGQYPAGVYNPASLVIPGLYGKAIDMTGSNVSLAVPYGPIYDALKDIGTTYQVGMSLTLDAVSDTGYSLGFRSYRGLDRTSRQSVNPIVRFSPVMESLTNIKELQSIGNLKTLVYTFAPSNPDGLATTPGYAIVSTNPTGFDLRARMAFEEDITTDLVGGDANVLQSLLNQRASSDLSDHHFIKYVDGEIVPTSQYKYGEDYNMGDIIEVEGNSGVTSNARVTEYIRAQDDKGEKAYPTVTIIE